MSYIRRFPVLLFILCALSSLAAPQARVRTYNIHDGMPSNYVTCIVQDSRDRVWIATWNGLSFYDGYRFVNFHDRSGEMASNRIVQLVATDDDRLWVLPYERHPFMLDPATGKFTSLKRLGGPDLTVKAMQTRGDTLWLQCENECWSVTGAASGKAHAKKHASSAWPGVGRGSKIKGAVPGARNHTDSRGRVWSIARDGNVYLNTGGEGGFAIVPTEPTPTHATISARALWLEDPYGNVWLAAPERPFCYYDEEKKTLVPYPILSSLPGDAPVTRIEVAMVDKQNNLWITPMHNLTVVSFNNSNLREVGSQYQSDTRSVAVAADGSVWMGSTDGTLCRYDKDGDFIGFLTGGGTGRLSVSQSPALFADRIYALLADSKGTMWVCTKGMGLYAVAPDGTIHRYTASGNPGDLPHDNIYDIDEDPLGNIWIATYGGGIALLRGTDNAPGKRTFHTPASGLGGYPSEGFNLVRRITHTPQGVMVASTTDGLLTFGARHTSPASIRFFRTVHLPGYSTSLTSNHLMHTLATSDGSLYIAPLGEMVLRAAPGEMLRDMIPLSPIDTGEAPHPFMRDHSPAGNVLSIVEGADGMVYLVLESCVLSYSPATGASHSIGYKDFDSAVEFTEAEAVCHPLTGHIWVPSARGCVVIDPRKTGVTDYRPRISVTVGADDDNAAYLVDPERVVLPAGTNNISLNMAALDYSTHELIRYAYSLDGDDWVYTGSNGSISLSGLSPGSHTLQIRSTNTDGIWSDRISSLEIYATPTFWESLLGRILIAIIILIVVGGILYLLYIWQKRPIANMLAKQKIMQESVIEQIGAHDESPSEETSHVMSKADRRLLRQLNEYIDSRISDESLRIDDIAAAMQMSRTLLYSRIKQLTGLSPSDLLRHLRMERAKRLIIDTDMTFSEIAYSVGYSDPKYFAKCFKKDIGVTPTEYRSSH